MEFNISQRSWLPEHRGPGRVRLFTCPRLPRMRSVALGWLLFRERKLHRPGTRDFRAQTFRAIPTAYAHRTLESTAPESTLQDVSRFFRYPGRVSFLRCVLATAWKMAKQNLATGNTGEERRNFRARLTRGSKAWTKKNIDLRLRFKCTRYSRTLRTRFSRFSLFSVSSIHRFISV